MSNNEQAAAGTPSIDIDIDQALGSFSEKERRVHRALKGEAEEQSDPEQGDPDVVEYFKKAITANELGGPLYCRHAMRSRMNMCAQRLHGARRAGISGEAIGQAEVNVEACSIVLCFVEAVVLAECGA